MNNNDGEYKIVRWNNLIIGFIVGILATVALYEFENRTCNSVGIMELQFKNNDEALVQLNDTEPVIVVTNGVLYSSYYTVYRPGILYSSYYTLYCPLQRWTASRRLV